VCSVDGLFVNFGLRVIDIRTLFLFCLIYIFGVLFLVSPCIFVVCVRSTCIIFCNFVLFL